MRRKTLQVLLLLLVAGWFSGGVAFAQATGTTGSINGRVTDSSGGVLPGVTVTVSSPSLLGEQVSVTDTGGNYRFPALPPGVYGLRYEIQGFKTLQRAGIQITINFTATVNAVLEVATLEETVTVTGDSPVIDATSTSVSQTFTMQQMANLPNARQMWSLIAATPSVTMSRTDVGGSEAGTQGNYMAYGFGGQRTVIMEGLNVTYDTGTSTFYPDYGSLEEVSVSTVSHSAAVANPGVQTELLTKSGGNKLSGELFLDYGNNAMQGSNIPDDVVARGVRDHSNEWVMNRNLHASLGGPLKRDKVWWHFAYHNQESSLEQPIFVGPMAGTTFDSFLYNYSVKATVQMNPRHRLITYYSRNLKEQPFYPVGTLVSEVGQTTNRHNDVTPFKVEWNGTLTNNLYAEARLGGNTLSSANLANSDTTAFLVVDAATGLSTGGDRKRQYTPKRKQYDGAISYFKDGWLGSHNFKFGTGLQLELKDDGYTQAASGNVRVNVNAGRPVSVVLYAPTARAVNEAASDVRDGDLTTRDRLTVGSAYFTDQWSLGRTTFNLGLRWDRYHGWSPEQEQLAYRFGPLNVPQATFPEQHYYTWSMVVPRIGVIHSLTEDGKTVVKLNYSLYAFNPGILLGGLANENQLEKSVTYAWSDSSVCPGCVAGDGLYQPGEEGALLASTLAGNTEMDRNLKQPTSTQATAFVERQLSEGVGARFGFVYYTVKNQVARYQAYRPPSAYTVPFTVVDRGEDNVVGTADDRTLSFLGIPNSQLANFPTRGVVTALPDNGAYKTIEMTLARRRTTWSLSAGGSYTWRHDFPAGYPNTANGPFDEDRRVYSFKANGSYSLPHEFQVSGVYQLKAGENYARTLPISAPASCACTFTQTMAVTPFNAYAQDNVSLLDLRVEKSLRLFDLVKASLFLDLYNVANAYAAEAISVATGPTFERPTAILAPRTVKVGFRTSW